MQNVSIYIHKEKPLLLSSSKIMLGPFFSWQPMPKAFFFPLYRRQRTFDRKRIKKFFTFPSPSSWLSLCRLFPQKDRKIRVKKVFLFPFCRTEFDVDFTSRGRDCRVAANLRVQLVPRRPTLSFRSAVGHEGGRVALLPQRVSRLRSGNRHRVSISKTFFISYSERETGESNFIGWNG